MVLVLTVLAGFILCSLGAGGVKTGITLVFVIGVKSEVTGIGGMPVNCLFLVLHLLPLRTVSKLLKKLSLFSALSFFTCSSRKSEYLSSASCLL